MSKKNEDSPIRDVLDDYVVLKDDDGNSVTYELLDIVAYQAMEFAILFPCDEPNADSVVIMQLIEDPEDPECAYYAAVNDEDMLDKIFDRFRELNRDNFNFID